MQDLAAVLRLKWDNFKQATVPAREGSASLVHHCDISLRAVITQKIVSIKVSPAGKLRRKSSRSSLIAGRLSCQQQACNMSQAVLP